MASTSACSSRCVVSYTFVASSTARAPFSLAQIASPAFEQKRAASISASSSPVKVLSKSVTISRSKSGSRRCVGLVAKTGSGECSRMSLRSRKYRLA